MRFNRLLENSSYSRPDRSSQLLRYNKMTLKPPLRNDKRKENNKNLL